jgi:N-acetylglucosamine kinase-like BadF-type ATPase
MATKLAFGSNLKQLRKKHGLTRAQLAQEINYSEKAIEKWEMGGSVPPVATVCRLADFFQISVDALLHSEAVPIRYLLGIDGGGTKTEFLLTDLGGQEINRLILGASNPVDIGIENTKNVLQEGIRQVCDQIPLREVSVYTGLAGGITGNNKETIGQFLKSMSFGAVASGSDVDTALEVCLHGGDGISLIMGTGIVAFAQQGGKRHRIAGWGYLLDKGGSGYNLGADALDSALRHVDGRGGSALLLQLIENRLQKSLPESISQIYASGKTGISSFAPLVFEALDQGDPEAERILRRNVQEVCGIIAAGCTHCPDNPKVAICGGLAKKGDVLLPFFEEYLNNTVRLEFVTSPIVNGAVALANKNKEELSC